MGNAVATDAAVRGARAGHWGARVRLRCLALWRRLDFDDRAALGMWAAAHLPLLVLAWAASWAYKTGTNFASLTGSFEHWDAARYRSIAQYGYFSPHAAANDAAFFPGYPLVLAELAVPAAAGCVAVVALARLAGDRRALLYLLTAPAVVFLLAGYSEGLFLAFAVPAWRAASRGRYGRAALLAALAGLVRPDGAFLAAALAVMALTGPRGRRLRDAGTACLGVAGPAAYEIYLRLASGSWDTWRKAMQAGWDLHLVTPVQAFRATWSSAFGHGYPAWWAGEMQLELASFAVIALAALAFLLARRWPEAVFCGLAAAALATQTWYTTSMRTLLVLFPVYVALVRLEGRRPWVRHVYLGVCAPLAAAVGLLFLAYQWAG